MLTIRARSTEDDDSIWSILEPTIRAGETYTLPQDITKTNALNYWSGPNHMTFVVHDDGEVVGTYYLRANQQGGGSHVANCGYMTHPSYRSRGVAKLMCLHSLQVAESLGFRAMQFNFVVSTNVGAVRLWESLGFKIVGRLPLAFRHPSADYVDAYVMFRAL
jgi:ribosomal protein S18 acetylase RimI-like enzyme